MCGISGIISRDPGMVSLSVLKQMTNRMAHRGPDGEGQWVNADGSVGLAHRRLSIIDLSTEANQPMHYRQRYTIVFNGEIYNYIELRNILLKQGYTFKTESDTEVLMALYDRDKENCLQHLDGMFAFVIYDEEQKQIFAARDRFGEKPFFYSYEPGNYFVFGSEMKTLWAAGIPKTINNSMLYNYLNFGLVLNRNDHSQTFFENCTRLPHSYYIKISTVNFTASFHQYYDLNWQKTDTKITVNEAKEKLQQLFYTAVNRRLRSDVNVGSSLSGGLDSSLIVCVIDDLIKRGRAEHNFSTAAFKQKTFSARFEGFKKDEGAFMQMVIGQTNVEPHMVYPNDHKLVADIDHLLYFQEEPFASASILVQYEVMKLAKQHGVTVLLDGQGADEIFAGYHGYYHTFFRTMEKQDKEQYKKEYQAYLQVHQHNDINPKQKKNLDYTIRKIFPGQITNIKQTLAFINQLKNNSFNKDFFSVYSKKLFKSVGGGNNLNQTLANSTMGGDLQMLLRYADRNSMANSIEVRLPFLSHELIDFLFTLPAEMKIHNGWTKYLMRETFKNILPEAIAWRVDKIGYEPPQKKWMEGVAMKENIMEARKKLVKEGILNKKILEKPPLAYGSLEKGDNSWAHLMAGKLM